MHLDLTCTLIFENREPIPMILLVRPHEGHGQRVIAERFELLPEVPTAVYTDGFGNACLRLLAPKGPFQVALSATVSVPARHVSPQNKKATPIAELPGETLVYLLPSRYCEADKLYDLAAEIAGTLPPGYAQAEAVRSWIYRHVRYQYGHSNVSTSAADTATQRIGVCRDFTHLALALCRALNLPARMAVGYLYRLEPMDLHAWFEIFLDGDWFAFDATQPETTGGRVLVAYGRDAADVALATYFGDTTFRQLTVTVSESVKGQTPQGLSGPLQP